MHELQEFQASVALNILRTISSLEWDFYSSLKLLECSWIYWFCFGASDILKNYTHTQIGLKWKQNPKLQKYLQNCAIQIMIQSVLNNLSFCFLEIWLGSKKS